MAPGQPELPEQPGEDGEDALLLDRGQGVAAEQEAAEVVRDRQRVAQLPVAGRELALEVGAPDGVGGLGLQGGGAGVLVAAAPGARAGSARGG